MKKPSYVLYQGKSYPLPEAKNLNDALREWLYARSEELYPSGSGLLATPNGENYRYKVVDFESSIFAPTIVDLPECLSEAAKEAFHASAKNNT